jgi:AcrR family transcriptional regulator
MQDAASLTASKGRQTRRQILDAALAVASRDGLAGLTIGELAKSVGMSKSGLFAHFRTKDALELAVLEAAVDRFVTTVFLPALKKNRGEPRIHALIENWLGFLNGTIKSGNAEAGSTKLPGGSVLISASFELDDRPGPARDFVQKAQRDLITNIEKSARIAVDEGHFRPDLDCEQFAWSLYSFVLGYHHFSRMLNDPKAELHLMRSVKGLLKVARGSPEKSSSSRRSKRTEKTKTENLRKKKTKKTRRTTA